MNIKCIKVYKCNSVYKAIIGLVQQAQEARFSCLADKLFGNVPDIQKSLGAHA